MQWLQLFMTPALMGLGGLISWLIKSKTEELKAIEQKLRQERIQVYGKILEPYIQLFTDLSDNNMRKAVKKILSYDYRKTAFELILLGNDEVVQAYNKLMQYTYSVEDQENKSPGEMLKLWGDFLLEIRKSLGNKKTALSNLDMLEFMIKDINKYRI